MSAGQLAETTTVTGKGVGVLRNKNSRPPHGGGRRALVTALIFLAPALFLKFLPL